GGGGGARGGGEGGAWGGSRASPHVSLTCARRTDSLLKRDGDLRLRVGDRLDRGGGAGNRRDARNAGDERGLADQVAVRTRPRTVRRVDDQVAASAADEIHHRGSDSELGHLAYVLDREPGGCEHVRGACGRDELEA